jgi:hypothetical protein
MIMGSQQEFDNLVAKLEQKDPLTEKALAELGTWVIKNKFRVSTGLRQYDRSVGKS